MGLMCDICYLLLSFLLLQATVYRCNTTFQILSNHIMHACVHLALVWEIYKGYISCMFLHTVKTKDMCVYNVCNVLGVTRVIDVTAGG